MSGSSPEVNHKVKQSEKKMMRQKMERIPHWPWTPHLQTMFRREIFKKYISISFKSMVAVLF
jgi:hypothetical protein